VSTDHILKLVGAFSDQEAGLAWFGEGEVDTECCKDEGGNDYNSWYWH
jgi:hypothetical protein